MLVDAGVDTQDDRLEVHIVGWGRRMRAWTLDYVVLPGDPAAPDVWTALTELLNSPIQHIGGALLQVEAVAIDAGGHRTEDVYHYVRQRRVRRPLAIFGAKANTAPVINRGTLIDFTYRGKPDKLSLKIHHVGTVAIKHFLYGRLSADADLPPDQRLVHFPDQLEEAYFSGLVSETYNPSKNRFEKKGSVRNEPLDTWAYAYAAAHHPELRLHRRTQADWDQAQARLLKAAERRTSPEPAPDEPPPPTPSPHPLCEVTMSQPCDCDNEFIQLLQAEAEAEAISFAGLPGHLARRARG